MVFGPLVPGGDVEEAWAGVGGDEVAGGLDVALELVGGAVDGDGGELFEAGAVVPADGAAGMEGDGELRALAPPGGDGFRAADAVGEARAGRLDAVAPGEAAVLGGGVEAERGELSKVAVVAGADLQA